MNGSKLIKQYLTKDKLEIKKVCDFLIKRFIRKLRNKRGSIYIYLLVLILTGIIILTFSMEYMRIYTTAQTIKESYENAILTVVTENYNEVYAGFREIKSLGGAYEGGAAGGGDPNAIPIWIGINDYGDIYIELMELLDIKDKTGNEERLVKTDNNGTSQFELYDFNLEVKDAIYSSTNKYEIRGYVMLNIPMHFAGVKISDIDVKVKVNSTYSAKY